MVLVSEQVTVKEVWSDPQPFKEMMGYSVVLADDRMAKMWLSQHEVGPSEGESFTVSEMVPPEAGKKQWKAKAPKRVGLASEAQNGSQALAQPALQPQSTYEALDTTQRLIIRQNALNRAVDWVQATPLEDNIEESVTVWLERFEQLIWQAASKEHEQKVLSWAGVPAKREVPPQSEGVPTSRSAGSSEGEGQTDPERQPDGRLPSPDARPKDGGVASAAPSSTLARVLTTKRKVGASDLEFSTFLTSMGVESPNDLTPEQCMVVVDWLTEGQEMAA